MKLLIKGGRVIDPSQGMDDKLDVLIANGVIKEMGRGSRPLPERRPSMRPADTSFRG